MIDIALLQSLYKKLTGKEYNKDLDNLHEIAEMLRALQQKDCFEGVIINGNVMASYTKIRSYSTGAEYSTQRVQSYSINYNKKTMTISQAAKSSYVAFWLDDDFNYINFKEAFVSSILHELSSCANITSSCPVVNTAVHLEAESVSGYIPPQEILYADNLNRTLQYDDADNGNKAMPELTTHTAIFSGTTTLSVGDEVFITIYTLGERGKYNLIGTISNIDTVNNKVTIDFGAPLNELMRLDQVNFSDPTPDQTIYYGKLVNKTDNPKAVIIKTSDSERVWQSIKIKILPNDPQYVEDAINLESNAWTLNIVNYGIKYEFDASSAETLHELELIDVDVNESDGIEKYKLRQDQVSPLYNGASRSVTNISDYGSSSRDAIVNKKLYMGPSGHQFDNWGGFENNKQVTSGFSSAILSIMKDNSYIYKLIADEKLYNLISLLRVVPIDLTKYKLKQRLWIDISDIDITSNTWQNAKAYIYEFKPATNTVIIHSRIKDETLHISDANLYTSGQPYELILIDENGNNIESTLPSWIDSISKTISTDTSGNIPIIYTTWKIKIKDNELLINNEELEKIFSVYVTSKKDLDTYTPGSPIVIKGRINIKLVPGLLFKFDNIISDFTTKFNNANSVTINGKTIKYSGYAADATPGHEELEWDSPYVRTMVDGTSSTTDDTFVDIEPHKNLRDKLYIASPYSMSKYTVYIMIKGVDTTNPNIIEQIRNRIKFAITDHNSSLSEVASNVYDPTPYTWHNPQTNEDENVLLVQAEWTGSQMDRIARNFSPGTKVTVTLYDSNFMVPLVKAESNIYIPAVIDLSATGTTTGESCDSINGIYSKIIKYDGILNASVSSYAQTNIHDLSAMTGVISLPTLNQLGIKLKTDNIVTVRTGEVKFIGNYMKRLQPVAAGLCGYNGIFTSWTNYIYTNKTNEAIQFNLLQISPDAYASTTRTLVSSIEPNVVDFVLIPGEVDNIYVKQELETLAGLKHLFYVTGESVSRPDSPYDGERSNPGTYTPTAKCPDGKHCYKIIIECCESLPIPAAEFTICTSASYNVGDLHAFAYDGTFWVGTVVEVPANEYDCGKIIANECKNCK